MNGFTGYTRPLQPRIPLLQPLRLAIQQGYYITTYEFGRGEVFLLWDAGACASEVCEV
jgi:hypothetical protein